MRTLTFLRKQGMDNTFYRVFVGGESVPGCAEQVQNYANRGVRLLSSPGANSPPSQTED